MTTTTNTNATAEPRACPYAVALEEDEQSAHSGAGDMLQQAKKSCPAFAGECPFSGATNPEEVREALGKVPKSHYKETYFREALQHLHTVGPSVESTEFQLPGSCPVSTYMKEQVPFHTALEEFSLASIMSRMARDLEGGVDEEEDSAEFDAPIKSLSTTEATAATATPAPRLSQAFKTGTAVSHQAAEDVYFVKNFVQGKIDRNLYADMILGLYHVYYKLETLLEQHKSTYEACHFPDELNRTAALQEDVDFWHGSVPTTKSQATIDYINRLEEIASTKPLLLLSHAYTRYLGDLSGGKVLKRVARRALNLDKKDGLAFYDFQNIKSAKVFKDEYRKALDKLDISSDDIQDLVQEANVAFLLNMRLFEELDVKANVPGAKVRDLQETLAFLQPPASAQPISEECPFLVNKKKKKEDGGRCPWPFVFLHDPLQGLQDYQTWIVVGLLLCWVWSFLY